MEAEADSFKKELKGFADIMKLCEDVKRDLTLKNIEKYEADRIVNEAAESIVKVLKNLVSFD